MNGNYDSKPNGKTYMTKAIVALVGRPNVGKSTLFNRITRTKDALVDDMPGVTRDRNYGEVVWNDTAFTLIDTGGFAQEDEHAFAGSIRIQVEQAVEESDAVILALDGKAGLSPYDSDIISMLRSSQKPVFYAINKIDGFGHEGRLADFYSLGIENPYAISAAHGYGITDLLDDLVKTLPQAEPEPASDMIKIAVVGRPNVGKSSLINRILGEERMLVSDIPGTTRDAIDTVCTVKGKSYLLIDTAGIRRKGRVSERIEKFSIIKALKGLDRCDVAIMVIDASEGVTDQDISVAGYAYNRGCGCIFLLNKSDMIEKEGKKAEKRLHEQLRDSAKFLNFAPSLIVSALTGFKIPKIFPMIDEVYGQYSTRIGTGPLNRILRAAIEKNEPPLHKGKRLKFYYATQISEKPPTFVLFVNYPEAVHFSYQRYLSNNIREGIGLDKTPLRLIFRLRTGKIEFGKKSHNEKK